jgi:hypothetical protein
LVVANTGVGFIRLDAIIIPTGRYFIASSMSDLF